MNRNGKNIVYEPLQVEKSFPGLLDGNHLLILVNQLCQIPGKDISAQKEVLTYKMGTLVKCTP